MHRIRRLFLFVASTLSICTSLFAASNVTCPISPVLGQTSFYLIEPLSCDPGVSPTKLFLSSDGNTTNQNFGSFQAMCLDNSASKVCNFGEGTIVEDGKTYECIRYFSDEHLENGWGIVRISDSATGLPVALIETGTQISTDYRIYSADDAHVLIGYVKTEENGAAYLKLRQSEQKVLARASKSLIPDEKACGKAVWQIDMDPAASTFTKVLVGYVLALKDNAGLSCSAPVVHGGTSPWPIVAAVAGGALVISLGALVWCHRSKQGNRYFKLDSINTAR